MQCPSCNSLLRREKSQTVEFDICPQCRGIWVSAEQFRAMAALVAAEEQVESSVKLIFKPRKVLQPLPKNEVLARNCPQRHAAMKEFNYAYDSNVFLHKCEQCKGIWLGPNEIIDIARHIQYNPELAALGKSYLDFTDIRGQEEKLEKCNRFIHFLKMILHVIIFRY